MLMLLFLCWSTSATGSLKISHLYQSSKTILKHSRKKRAKLPFIYYRSRLMISKSILIRWTVNFKMYLRLRNAWIFSILTSVTKILKSNPFLCCLWQTRFHLHLFDMISVNFLEIIKKIEENTYRCFIHDTKALKLTSQFDSVDTDVYNSLIRNFDRAPANAQKRLFSLKISLKKKYKKPAQLPWEFEVANWHCWYQIATSFFSEFFSYTAYKTIFFLYRV